MKASGILKETKQSGIWGELGTELAEVLSPALSQEAESPGLQESVLTERAPGAKTRVK